MTLEEIKAIRNKLPDNWKWNKVYELPYFNSRTGREFCRKHWALTALDRKGLVCSLGLISHDYSSDKKHFMEDVPVQFVEKSLTIIDSLLTEIERLQTIKLLESKKTIALNPDWCQHSDTCINKVCIGHPGDCEEDKR